jgi:phosphopantothenoylcysteine decarboxylase/phosphopantothenate--cysteine ligase
VIYVESNIFLDKTIVIGVTGGVAAYKAAGIASYLARNGADVHVVMTDAATMFVTPLLFETLSRNPVMINTFKEESPKYISHIHYADKADLILVVPLTENTLAKVSMGFADNMLTNILLAVSDFDKVLLCPAMNVNMLRNPVTEEHLQRVEKRGMNIMNPASGPLACGYDADGKLPDNSEIIKEAANLLERRKIK